MSLVSIPYIILLAVFYGTTLVVSRFSVGQYHPTNYVAIRLMLASFAHILIYVISRKQTIPRDKTLWKRGAIYGIIGTSIPMTLIVSSMLFQSSGMTAILLTTNPAITVIFAHFLTEDERLNWKKGLGALIALGGAVFLTIMGENGLQDTDKASPWGYILVLFAMFFTAGSSIYVKKYLSGYRTFDVASIRMVTAAVVVAPLTAIFVGFDLSQVTLQGYEALGYASLVGTFSGMLLSIYLINRFGVTPYAMSSYVIPIVTAIVGSIVLDEIITPAMLMGIALIVMGIAMINWGGRTKKSVLNAKENVVVL